MRTLSRRTVLKGLLGGAVVTVGLPWLEIFSRPASASAGLFPQRFGLFFWGNGVHPDRWVPSETGPDWPLSDQLAPLESVKDVVTVVSGLEVKVPNQIPHASGAAGILTGTPLVVEGESNTFAAPSIDQVVAAELGNATRFRSLEFGASPSRGRSYNGPHSTNPPETSPYTLWERIFGTGFRAPGDDGEVDPTIGLRRSVLDAVAEDARTLKGKLGHEDSLRLEQHLTGIRELETRLARLEEDPPDLASCMAAPEPEGNFDPIDGRPQISAKNRAMCDIIALALACDQTRVFSNFITDPVNDLLFEGASAGHHQLTHDEPGDQPQVHEIVLSLVAEFGYLVEALRAIPEGDGTLLDNCVVLGTTDVSYGRTHSLDEFPILLAGSACGQLKTGEHVRYTAGENASRMHLTLMQALGMRAESFGEEDGYTEDNLSEVLV
jgi:hypothetical protein